MIIEDPESFKSWLTARLEPLCDADPAALAKYVYALVKKDKPVEELRSSMIGQLEVFLQKETQGFVNLLFKTLETQDYETKTENPSGPAASAPAPPPPSQANKTTNSEFETRSAFIVPSLDETEKKLPKEPSAAILASAQNSNSLGCALLATAAGRRDSEKHIRKADSDKEDRSRRRIRRGSSVSPDRGRRTRSRSFDRRRSRSRERDRARAWRNKSPPSRGRYDRDRRHTHSKSPIRRYSKSRSPVGNRRTRYRNRSPPRSRSRTRSRSPFTSKYSNSDSRERKDGAIGISPRGENNVHGDTDLRLPAIPQNIQSVVALPAEPNFQTRRCRDFDEKGYCMRGDLCPFDHGSDPVILEDVVPLYNGSGAPVTPLLPQPTPPPQLRQPLQPPPVTTNNMAEYNPDAPSMEPRMWTRPQFRPGPMMRGGMMRGGMGMGRGFPPHQRELINVVTASATGGPPPFRHSRAPLSQDFNNGRVNIGEKQCFDYNRLGLNRPMRGPFSGQGGNTSLQLKKVPLGVNNITLLNNHFSKFGKIINIQVGFEGDPESALITFSTHTEANVAYKSTEAVLNNRFIRVFWYNPNNSNSINKDNNTNLTSNNNNNNESKQENTPPGGGGRQSVLERLGAPTNKVVNNIQPPTPTVLQQQEEKVTLTNNNLSKTLYIPSAMKKEIAPPPTSVVNKELATPLVEKCICKKLAAGLPNTALKKKIEEVTIAKKKQEEARKAGIKLNADLRKRKQELLEKQINQQKLLIQRMEAKNISTQQKNTLMATIKALQESIEKIRKDLSSCVKANLTKVAKKGTTPNDQIAILRKSKEEVQRELLDAELDLLSSQHEGKDTTEIKKKVLELKQRAVVLGVSSTRGSFRGRRGALKIRGRGRGRGSLSRLFLSTTTIGGNAYDHNVVDHRPTKILVSGYEQDDKAEVITHFEQYGEILDYISDDATPSLVLNYKARKEAELAILKGRNFNDRLLSVTWATPNTSIRGGIPTKPPTPSHRQVMVMEDEENILAEDTLEDVEDEDEDIGILSPDILIHDDEDEDEEDRSWRR